jgi:RNA polymerase sigma-70 factor (ECF subfamily)
MASLRVKARGARRVRPEDEAEFADLVERQWKFVYRVAWAVLRNAFDAEDAAQETFLKIWRAREWREVRDEKAYLARIAWRASVDRLRARRGLAFQTEAPAARTREGSGHAGVVMEDLADTGMNPEELAAAGNWEAAVHRLMDSLPEELRQVLTLSVEMNSREIAAARGVADGTVRTRLMRARGMLREKMAAMEERRYAGG